MPFAFRRALPTDAAALAQLTGQDAAVLGATLVSRPEEHRVWLLDEDHAVIGVCRTAPAGPEHADLGPRVAEVLGLLIAPERRGAGRGRRLLGHAVNDLLVRGFGPVCAHVGPTDAGTRAFFARHGFAADGPPDAPERVRLVRQR
jgi:ribosomal protein S18 acetylase RimI-like enzyme